MAVVCPLAMMRKNINSDGTENIHIQKGFEKSND